MSPDEDIDSFIAECDELLKTWNGFKEKKRWKPISINRENIVYDDRKYDYRIIIVDEGTYDCEEDIIHYERDLNLLKSTVKNIYDALLEAEESEKHELVEVKIKEFEEVTIYRVNQVLHNAGEKDFIENKSIIKVEYSVNDNFHRLLPFFERMMEHRNNREHDLEIIINPLKRFYFNLTLAIRGLDNE